MPPGTTVIEQRTIASAVPTWNSSMCTQCNICAFVCPHAAIRPVLATPEELSTAPGGFNTLPIKGSKDLAGYQYRVQVSPQDCTGCELCVHVCPVEALTPAPISDVLATEAANWEFMKSIPNRGELFDKTTVSTAVCILHIAHCRTYCSCAYGREAQTTASQSGTCFQWTCMLLLLR